MRERKFSQPPGIGRSAEGRYRLLIEGITDYAIYMLDSAGLVASWNCGAERFKGYSEGEIIGQHFSRFYTEEDKAIDLSQTALRTAREEGRFDRVDLLFLAEPEKCLHMSP